MFFSDEFSVQVFLYLVDFIISSTSWKPTPMVSWLQTNYFLFHVVINNTTNIDWEKIEIFDDLLHFCCHRRWQWIHDLQGKALMTWMDDDMSYSRIHPPVNLMISCYPHLNLLPKKLGLSCDSITLLVGNYNQTRGFFSKST